MQNAANTKGRVLLIISRVVVYTILIFLSALCLFSFYMLIINATRSNAQLQAGFTLLPKDHFFENLQNAWTDASINIPRGMLNSFLIAASSAVLTTYFSALTAYGIHVYKFKLNSCVGSWKRRPSRPKGRIPHKGRAKYASRRRFRW